MPYRKKPVIVEAFQMTRRNRSTNVGWPDWLIDAWNKPLGLVGSLYPAKDPSDGTLLIFTLEGQHLVSINDWIIRGVKGEIYPCKPDIFEETYEKV